MATKADGTTARSPRSRAPDGYERILAIAAILLLIAVAAALVRGRAHWGEIPPAIWLHLATIIVALALTPVMLLRERGDTLHRRLGRVWSAAIFATALLSFLIRESNHGRFSAIHILSAFTLLTAPLLVLSARAHKVDLHRMVVRGMVTGALLIAGFFTFPFGRLLGRWLFG